LRASGTTILLVLLYGGRSAVSFHERYARRS